MIEVMFLAAAMSIAAVSVAIAVTFIRDNMLYNSTQSANIGRQSSLHDMKAIVKTWRNRLPLVSDSLSHWNDIFTWRQHHYELIVQHYEVKDK